MCIIVYKPKGVEMPSLDVLRNCFDHNKDGCGVAIRMDNNKIKFKKGLMTFEDVEKMYQEIKDLKDSEVCMHFRLTSAGLTIPEQTHPFPIGSENALDGETSSLIFHNGTMINLSYDPVKSDTQILSEILANMPYEKIKDVLRLAGGKFVYMDENVTFMIGEFIEDNGVFYSNTGYKYPSIFSHYSASNIGTNYIVDTCSTCTMSTLKAEEKEEPEKQDNTGFFCKNIEANKIEMRELFDTIIENLEIIKNKNLPLKYQENILEELNDFIEHVNYIDQTLYSILEEDEMFFLEEDFDIQF